MLAAIPIAGCGRGDAPRAMDDVPQLDALEHLLGSAAVQRYGTQHGAGSISRVAAARITPDGRHVVVLDGVAPFLRVFDRTGRITHQAVSRGGGPTELQAAAALAATDDRALILGDALLVAPLTPAGAAARLLLPARLMDVGTDCGGRLVGYGPAAGGTRPSFVHVLSVDSPAAVVASLYPDALPQRLSFGHGRAGITGGSSGSTLVHKLDDGVKLLFLNCGGALEERQWAWAVPRFPSQKDGSATGEERGGDVMVLTLNPAEPLFSGAGELPDGSLLWLESRLPSSPRADNAPDEPDEVTYFYLADSTGSYGGHVPGSFSLQDISPAGVLLSTREPYPAALLVPWADLVAAIRQGRSFPRPHGQ